MNEWTDITDGQNTKLYKWMKIFRFCINVAIYVFFIICVVAIGEVLKQLAPYVNDSSLVLEKAFTNSQITAIMCMLTLAWSIWTLWKMISRVIRW